MKTKPKFISLHRIPWKREIVTVKELKLEDGNTEARFFIYTYPNFPNAGGYGWKDLEKMLRHYEWLKSHDGRSSVHTRPPDINSKKQSALEFGFMAFSLLAILRKAVAGSNMLAQVVGGFY
jgi:hypothetical protein